VHRRLGGAMREPLVGRGGQLQLQPPARRGTARPGLAEQRQPVPAHEARIHGVHGVAVAVEQCKIEQAGGGVGVGAEERGVRVAVTLPVAAEDPAQRLRVALGAVPVDGDLDAARKASRVLDQYDLA